MDAVCSGIVVYGCGDIVFGAKRSNQWMQYTVDVVCSGYSGIVYMVVGTLSLIQKGQSSGRSTQLMQWNSGIWWWGHCQRSNQWIQWTQSHSGHSTQWTQWTQYTVDAVCSAQWLQWNSGIWWWGHCLLYKKVKPVDAVDVVCSKQWNSGIWWWGHCLWCKKVKPVDAVDAVHSECSMQWNSGIWWWGLCL